MSYHINPKTGNPNVCKALKGKCPFGDAGEHFPTKESAQRVYEERQKATTALTGHRRNERPSYKPEGPHRKPTTLNEAFKRLSYLRGRIFTQHREGRPFAEILGLINERDELEARLKTFPRTTARGKQAQRLTTDLPAVFQHEGPRKGYTNDSLTSDEDYIAATGELRRLSEHWMATASSADVWAISRYCYNSKDYAKEIAAGGELSQEWQDFESAIEHAPTMEPIVTYSGLNEYVGPELEAQAKTGRLKLDRVLSASINPAIVNVFKSWRDEDSVAFEILTDKAAFASAVTHREDEMEIFIPKGDYEVVAVLEDVAYHWPSGNGTSAKRVYQLRKVS